MCYVIRMSLKYHETYIIKNANVTCRGKWGITEPLHLWVPLDIINVLKILDYMFELNILGIFLSSDVAKGGGGGGRGERSPGKSCAPRVPPIWDFCICHCICHYLVVPPPSNCCSPPPLQNKKSGDATVVKLGKIVFGMFLWSYLTIRVRVYSGNTPNPPTPPAISVINVLTFFIKKALHAHCCVFAKEINARLSHLHLITK